MTDTMPVPGGSATPAAPAAIPYTGAPVPPPRVLAGYPAAVSTITILAGLADRIAPRLSGATGLESLTILDALDSLVITDAALPASLDNLNLGEGCVAGDWVDALIAALPDRSGDDSGTYTDVELILTAAQIDALEAKGFSA